jgi:DNA-directed RNA polymerase subunit RPC12/RpoP
MYKCLSCKKEITEQEDKIRCPYCGFRVYSKMRPEIDKRVRAV